MCASDNSSFYVVLHHIGKDTYITNLFFLQVQSITYLQMGSTTFLHFCTRSIRVRHVTCASFTLATFGLCAALFSFALSAPNSTPQLLAAILVGVMCLIICTNCCVNFVWLFQGRCNEIYCNDVEEAWEERGRKRSSGREPLPPQEPVLAAATVIQI